MWRRRSRLARSDAARWRGGRRHRGKLDASRRRRRSGPLADAVDANSARGRAGRFRGVNEDAAAAQLWWPLPLSSLPQYSWVSALQCIPLQRQASEQTGSASKSLTSVQSSFLIFVRTGHSAKSWSPRAAGRSPTAVLNGGDVAAAATRAVMCRSIIKIAPRSRVPAPRSRRGDSCRSVWS